MSLKDKSPVEIQAVIDQYFWWHSIDFGNGIISKGQASLDMIKDIGGALTDGLDWRGKSLLDVGAWNGAYSIMAKQKGAGRVVGSDYFVWTHPEFKGRETFDIAVELTGLDIARLECDLPHITPDNVGKFDAVLFSGVFYHLLDPIGLTRSISECASHVFIMETHQDCLDCARPGMIMYPGISLNNDPTNWWGPNPQCVYELLKEFGFDLIFYQDTPSAWNDPKTSAFRSRGVYHAFRSAESLILWGGGNPAWLNLNEQSVRNEVFKPL